MKFVHVLFAVVAALTSVESQASGFEFCDMVGEVREPPRPVAEAKRTFQFDVIVVSAARAKRNGADSYTDCAEYVGKPLTIELQVPRRVDAPQKTDRIAFHWSAVDGFNADGSFAGTGVTTQFISVRKNPPANEG